MGRMKVDVYETWGDASDASIRRCTERVKRSHEHGENAYEGWDNAD